MVPCPFRPNSCSNTYPRYRETGAGFTFPNSLGWSLSRFFLGSCLSHPKTRREQMMTYRIMRTKWLAGLLALAALLSWSSARAEVRIVCIGDSNIAARAYRAARLIQPSSNASCGRAEIDATVTNAGISGDTATGVVARLDSSVPNGTDVAGAFDWCERHRVAWGLGGEHQGEC
jgi:hypothetical protein